MIARLRASQAVLVHQPARKSAPIRVGVHERVRKPFQLECHVDGFNRDFAGHVNRHRREIHDRADPCTHDAVSDGLCTVAIVSDTSASERIWEVLNELPRLDALFLEVSFPDSMKWVADKAIRPVDPALAPRLTAAMFLGVLILQLLGDPVLEARQDELPDAMADILLHGVMENEHDEHA